MYHLYSNAIIVKSNLSKLLSKDNIFHKYNDNTELLVMRFKNEDKTEGFVSRLVNIHMLPADESRIAENAVDFISIGDYTMFFTSSVSFVYKAMLAFESLYSKFTFEIIKHPFNFSSNNLKSLEDFIQQHLLSDKITELSVDNMFGFKSIFVVNDQPHILNFYSNGLIVFEMMNEKEHIENIFNFIIQYHNYYKNM